MSLRTPLIQIILLLAGLVSGSFVSRSGLPVALMEVRLPLVLVLIVALSYLYWQVQLPSPVPQPIRNEDEGRAQEHTR